MRLFLVIIPLILFGIVEISEIFADESLYYISSIDADGTDLLRGISAIAASGDYVYAMAYQDNRLVIVDVSDPNNPFVTASFFDNDETTLDISNDIAVSGNYLYVVSEFNENGVSIIDVSDPVNPKHTGTLFDDDSTLLVGANGIDVVGNIAYVTSGMDNAVTIIDVSDPANPIPLSSIMDDDLMALNHPQGITVVGNIAYVTSIFDHGLAIIDVSDPTNPKHLSSIFDDDVSNLVQSDTVTVVGNIAYVGSIFDHAVTIIDVSDPAHPKHLSSIVDDDTTALKGTTDIIVNGDYAYVGAYHDGGIEILDISNPLDPTHVDSITKFDNESLFGAGPMAMVNEYVYVGTANGFDILTTNSELASHFTEPLTSTTTFADNPSTVLSLESVIVDDSQPLFTMSNFRITDFYGNINENLVGKKFFIEFEITNNLDVRQEFVYNLTYEDQNGIKNIEPYLIKGYLNASYTYPTASHTLEFPSPGKYEITVDIWNNDNEKRPLTPTTSYDIIIDPDSNHPFEVEPSDLSEKITTHELTERVAPFVNPEKDPQHYVDRYNNEESYREWFDTNYSQYDSIYHAVGLDELTNIVEISRPLNYDPEMGMKHIFTFGNEETNDWQFNRPTFITIDKDNQVYVLDSRNNRIHTFSSDGEHLFSFGESIVDQFGYLTDIAVDDNGKIYVCDNKHHKIHVFSNVGEYLFSFGSKGIGEGKLYKPRGLEVRSDSRIYVTDNGNSRIQVFSDTGDSIFSFGEKGSEDGQFFNPHGIDIDSDGNVFVVDSGNSRIQIFTSEGKHLLSFGEHGYENGQFHLIRDVAVDNENNIYVSNESLRQIQVFSSDGTYLFSFGSFDVGAANRFQSPVGLAVGANNTIYVVDAGKKDIKVFGTSTKTKTNLTTDQVLLIGLSNAKQEEFSKSYYDSIVSRNVEKLSMFVEREILLSSALGVSVDTEGKIFVADNRANLIKVFSDKGEYLYGFGGEQGIGTGNLSTLIGMDMDSKNNLYVANTGKNVIQVFSNDGNFLYEFGRDITDDGKFEPPTDVAVGKDGRIYVVDSINPGIQVFANDGEYLFNIDTANDYSYESIHGIDVDDEKIYVVDNFFVMVFSMDGDYLYGFANVDQNTDSTKRSVVNVAVTVDNDGRIYVADRNNRIINIFSNDGIYLHTIDGSDSEGKFNMPKDVDVDNDGKIYVADHGHTRIQVFSLNDDNDIDNNSLDHSMTDVSGYEKIIETDPTCGAGTELVNGICHMIKTDEKPSFFENIFEFFKSLSN